MVISELCSEEEIAFVHQTVEELDAVKYAYEQERIRSQVGSTVLHIFL